MEILTLFEEWIGNGMGGWEGLEGAGSRSRGGGGKRIWHAKLEMIVLKNKKYMHKNRPYISDEQVKLKILDSAIMRFIT